MEDQDEFLIRKSEYEEVQQVWKLETNNKAVLEDVGQNADLYIANQEDNTQNQAPGQRRVLDNVK